MSGKSTFLRQVALITILAHCGCYVPASFAHFRLTDSIFTRISTSDHSESNAGTFAVEMREAAFIMQHATNKSLILIDELGRGTATLEGSAIAWSICEYLLMKQAYSIFVTHFSQLAELEALYPNVKNYHMSVQTSNNGNGTDEPAQIEYLYNIEMGTCKETQYGIVLAEMMGFPQELIKNSRQICKIIMEKQQVSKQVDEVVEKKRFEMDLVSRLMNLKRSSMNIEGIQQYLATLQEQLKL